MTARVLVTRGSSQAGALEAALREEGLEPIGVPAISVEIDAPGGALDAMARVLHTFDWVVVTSPNGAKAILTAAERVFTSLGTPAWAAIGDATAEILEREDVRVDVRPHEAAAVALAEELPLVPGQEVLVVRGNLAGNELSKRLQARGALVTDVVAYRTIEGPPASRPILRDAFAPGRPDAVVFASGSAARGLLALADAEGLEVGSIPAICIGPQTEREAIRLGFHVLASSADPDIRSLAATTAAVLAEPVHVR
jgi:uroporphyrinogen-III synthase